MLEIQKNLTSKWW